MTETPFAYCLAHDEDGWRWRILDEDGETVANGLGRSRADAQAAVEASIRRAALETAA